MHNSFLLPFDKSPIIESNFGIGYLYAIVSGNIGESYMPWICEKYINCSFSPFEEKHFLNISVWDNPSSRKGLMQYQTIDMKKEVFRSLKSDIQTFFIKLLSMGIYIVFRFKWKYLLPSPEKETEEDIEEGVIIGYHLSKKEFVIKKSSPENGIKTYHMPFLFLENALYDTPESHVHLHFWYYRKETTPKMDISVICNFLQDYLNSTNRKARYPMEEFYGLRAIEAFISESQQRAREKGILDQNSLRAFYEHKYFMKIRMNYLASQGLVPPEIPEYANQVFHLTESAVKLCKSSIQKQDENIKPFDLMRETLIIEKEYLTKSVNYLRPVQ